MKLQTYIRSLLVIALLVGGLSLTTPAEAQSAATTKVIWCPVAVTIPTPNKKDCTAAFSTMTDLWNALVTKNPAKAGTIWIGKGYINTAVGVGDGNQIFDGATLTNMLNFPLTIQGGWNGLGTGTLSSSTPSTFDGASFTIQNWTGDVTLRNLFVKNATTPGCAIAAAVCGGGRQDQAGSGVRDGEHYLAWRLSE
jgi:hypothetical protein